MSMASAEQLYTQCLGHAHARILHVWEPATVARRNKQMQELFLWLAQLPPAMNKTLITCTPADLLVFMEGCWLLRHAGTKLPYVSLVASPSGVSSCFAHLSTGFQLLGRIGEWDPLTSKGNPTQSTDVYQYKKGYQKEIWRLGYLEGSAVPMSSHKVFQLIDYPDSCLQSSPRGLPQLLLEHDLMLILLMWETPLRGNNNGRVNLDDLFTTKGQPFLSPNGYLQLPPAGVPVGWQLSLPPNGTKTVKCQRPGPFMLMSREDSKYSFLARLPGYLGCLYLSGIISSKFLFSPLTPNRRSLADGPMSATSLGHRVRKHWEDLGLYDGESNHGFRRGQIQSMAAQGMSKEQIGEAAQIKTARIVELYADVTRHQPRLQRLGKRGHDML